MPRMAPAGCPRPLWVWSLPSLVILLSLVWYKRKRNTLRSDPGGTLKLLPDAAESERQDVGGKVYSNPSALTRNSSSEPKTNEAIGHSDCIKSVCGSKTEFDSSVELSGRASSSETISVSQIEADKATVAISTSPIAVVEESAVCKTQISLACEVLASRKEEEFLEPSVEISEVVSIERKEVEETSSKGTSIECFKKEVGPSLEKMKNSKEVEVPVRDVKDDNVKVESLEGKLASLALGSSDEQRRGAERDSANHSPVDAMLASPSMSSYSDEHSEGSSDSGKCCSDVASPPSRTPVGSGSLAGDAEVDTAVESTNGYSVYDFLLPQLLVGRLIGRNGCFVREIKAKTNATIWINKHPDTAKQKICSVEGTSAEIDNALALIRQQFPLNKYPNVSLEQISLAPTPTTFPLVPDFCQLHLVEGVNNEVMISSLVSPAHMFVQQPYHPTYQFLQRLNLMMNSVYTRVQTPNLPDPIEGGNICVAPALDGWYRAQIVSSNKETQTSEIKFVDYGGYTAVNNSVLRQIRQDFMTLPFQASECYLANIKPSGESGEWSLEALGIVEELTRGQMLLAQVYDYAADGVPLIYLYSSINNQVVLINQELVARGMADLDDSILTSNSAEAASLVVAAKAVAAAAASETSSNDATEDSPTSSSTVETEDKTSTN